MLELKHIFLDSLQLVNPITCDQHDVCAMVLFSFSAEAKPISFFTNFSGQCFGLEAESQYFLITKNRALLLIARKPKLT